MVSQVRKETQEKRGMLDLPGGVDKLDQKANQVVQDHKDQEDRMDREGHLAHQVKTVL